MRKPTLGVSIRSIVLIEIALSIPGICQAIDIYEPDDLPLEAKEIFRSEIQNRSIDPSDDTDWIRYLPTGTFNSSFEETVTITIEGIYDKVFQDIFHSSDTITPIAGTAAFFGSPLELTYPLQTSLSYLFRIRGETGDPIFDYSIRLDVDLVPPELGRKLTSWVTQC